MNRAIQVFLYPEEIEHASPTEVVELIRDLGADTAIVAVMYHRSRRVFPRHQRVSVLAAPTLYLSPDRRRYERLVPEGHAHEGLLRFRDECRAAGLRFHAWVVGLHHELLAAAHPDVAARLLDGSPAGHSLCPSSPDAIAYVAALAADVAAQLRPDAVDLEAGFYPAWEPSYTLTLALEPLSERARLLGSQCFCGHCTAILGDDLETRTQAAAGPPFGHPSDDDDVRAELGALRAKGAASLIREVARAVHGEGTLLRVFCSGPSEQAALQGVAPEPAASADAVLFGCGPLGGVDLLERFTGLRALAGRSGTVSTNWTPARETFAADAERLARDGAKGLALYNLSLVPDAGIDAFRMAATSFREAATVPW
ncbi:MAG: hypothetical protein M5U27_16545 [Gaiella sp.]|nr:hypothetical protein [Gaiella sp.]